jgi:DNA-binding CsgD family transcriptional regulator
MIDHNFTHDKEWDDFRQVFEKVHTHFFEKLSQRSPDLTPAELRLAALFRLNMSSKDMAATLGISQDSLRIARYRLKKKLQLPEEENLIHYLLGL